MTFWPGEWCNLDPAPGWLHALVLSCDEKSQVQALDRTQPGLPLKKGRAQIMTHDYKRNGTTTLFAAIDMTQGKVIASCMPRHRHQEWIKFLKLIDAQTPAKTKTMHDSWAKAIAGGVIDRKSPALV